MRCMRATPDARAGRQVRSAWRRGCASSATRRCANANYGAFEGRTFTEVERDFPAEYERFRTRDPHYVPPGGESAAQFRDRVMAALERIASGAAGKRVAVITHGGVLGIVYRHAMDIPLEARRGYSLANASLNHFRYAAGRWLLETWGDVAQTAKMTH